MSREFDELLSAYLDGEVSPEERAAVERRLEQSPALRETLDELSEVGDLIRSLPRARAPIDLPERVVAAISPTPLASTAQPRKRNRLFGAWPLMAAGTVLAAGVAIVVLLPRQRENAANGVALNETSFGTEVAWSEGLSRGLGEAEDGTRRSALAVESAGTTDNFEAAAEKSLTETVRKLDRRLQPGEVIDTLENNAGRTQVVRYIVVDTHQIGPTMNTILTNNSFNIVETETPAPRGGATAAPATNDRYVYYVEGPPEQVEQTLEQIERLPEFRQWDDLGVLASDSDSDPIPVELFADTPAKPVNEFGLSLQKDKADRPAAAPAGAPRFAASQLESDFAKPALAPATPAIAAEANRAKEVLLGDQVESKAAESGRRLAPAAAPAQESVPRSEVEKLSAAATPQATNAYLGVSARVDSNAPIVENVLKRAPGNAVQGNAVQGNALQDNLSQRNAIPGNSPQRQSVGQTQSNFFRARSMRLTEEQLGRRNNESAVGDQQKKLSEAKGAVLLKQQVGNRSVADNASDLEAAIVANPGNVPSQEDGFVRALIILEPQPAAPVVTEPAPKKAGD